MALAKAERRARELPHRRAILSKDDLSALRARGSLHPGRRPAGGLMIQDASRGEPSKPASNFCAVEARLTIGTFPTLAGERRATLAVTLAVTAENEFLK